MTHIKTSLPGIGWMGSGGPEGKGLDPDHPQRLEVYLGVGVTGQLQPLFTLPSITFRGPVPVVPDDRTRPSTPRSRRPWFLSRLGRVSPLRPPVCPRPPFHARSYPSRPVPVLPHVPFLCSLGGT